MNITFNDIALEELYTKGSAKVRKYKKLLVEIVKQYVKTVNYIKAATRVEDLFAIKSLHYEKKAGDLNGVEVVWINTQYRLHFQSSPDGTGIIVNALIIKISKHYE